VTDGVTRRVGFWTRNAEGPLPLPQQVRDVSESGGATRSADNNDDTTCSLVGGSVWGMIRSAALEIDSRVLSMVCIDTDHVMTANEAWSQVWQELVLPHWNASSDDTVGEVEICYRGETQFLRRLCASRIHIMGNSELDMKLEGMQDDIVALLALHVVLVV